MRIARGHVEVLECQECGFLGTIDLYHVENNSTRCPECGYIYLGYSQVPREWYYTYKAKEFAKSFTMEKVTSGRFPQYERREI